MKNYYSVKSFDVCFHHLIIFSANFQKDIRKWGAILIRNVSTSHTLRCPFSPPQNRIADLRCPYKVINRFLGFGVLHNVYHYNSINTAPICPILKSHYELAFSATILECFYSPKSNQSHRFEKIYTTFT